MWIFCGFDARLRFLPLYDAFYSLIAQLAVRGAVNSEVPGSNPGEGVWERMESVLRYEDGLSIITSEFDSQVFNGN